jgi:hypothetical protein
MWQRQIDRTHLTRQFTPLGLRTRRGIDHQGGDLQRAYQTRGGQCLLGGAGPSTAAIARDIGRDRRS